MHTFTILLYFSEKNVNISYKNKYLQQKFRQITHHLKIQPNHE